MGSVVVAAFLGGGMVLVGFVRILCWRATGECSSDVFEDRKDGWRS